MEIAAKIRVNFAFCAAPSVANYAVKVVPRRERHFSDSKLACTKVGSGPDRLPPPWVKKFHFPRSRIPAPPSTHNSWQKGQVPSHRMRTGRKATQQTQQIIIVKQFINLFHNTHQKLDQQQQIKSIITRVADNESPDECVWAAAPRVATARCRTSGGSSATTSAARQWGPAKRKFTLLLFFFSASVFNKSV